MNPPPQARPGAPRVPGAVAPFGSEQQTVVPSGVGPGSWAGGAPPDLFSLAEVEGSIPGRFEAQVLSFADRVAIKGPAHTLSYRDLNKLANRIGHAILGLCGEGEEAVGLLLAKDAPLIAALLGILKTGKLYVPLEPAHPEARLRRILDDAQARLIVTDGGNLALSRALAGSERVPLNIEDLDPELRDEDLSSRSGPDTLAYVVYTSGSTGEPKGVVQNHRNILHNTRNHTNCLRISPDDRLSLIASVSTGQAMTDIFSALLNGAGLHPFDLREQGLDRLADWLREEEITIYHSSASIFHHLLAGTKAGEDYPRLRVVKIGSEPLARSDVDRYRERFGSSCLLVNALSSTEVGMMRQMIIDADTPLPEVRVPVGFPVDGKEVLLLDDEGRRVGFDTPGEIVVRSRYLAAGYWRNPELTRQAFQQDPGGGARIFRTGDQGRMTADGCLEYLGRRDLQTKIRGFRVELAEVEATLRGLPSIGQAAVVARDDEQGGRRLVAYVVAAVDPFPSSAALRASMRERVPDHMVPAEFVRMDALPLTPSGKVDRGALPAGAHASPVRDASPVDPRSPAEWRMAEIWEELLNVKPVGLRDDFFSLGGHSLLAVRLLDRIAEVFGTRLPLRTLFAGATVEHLARALLETSRDQFHSRLLPIQPRGSRPPFFYLHGDWFGGFYCRDLARLLGEDQPFYALQPHGIDGGPIPGSIEEMAADQLRVLLEFRPEGPYLLGGYCNGGVVAFEMARQMQKMRIEVELLVLVDASGMNVHLKWPRRVVAIPGALLRFDRDRQVDWAKRLLSLGTHLRGLFRKGGRAQGTYLLDSVRRLAGSVFHSRERRPQIRRGVALASQLGEQFTFYRSAIRGYVPGKYAGAVAFLRSGHIDPLAGDDPTAGWGKVVRDVEVHRIPGQHVTCLTEHVETLADHMAGCLLRANQRLRQGGGTRQAPSGEGK